MRKSLWLLRKRNIEIVNNLLITCGKVMLKSLIFRQIDENKRERNYRKSN
jgi:hypothetical protein